jgi:hypothetical protein
MMSPSGVLISSPTMTRTPTFWPAAVTAAEVSLWSVMNTTSRLSRAARSASSSSVVTASPDATVCRWQSTRTRLTGSPRR